jgi:hypothetical protein
LILTDQNALFLDLRATLILTDQNALFLD